MQDQQTYTAASSLIRPDAKSVIRTSAWLYGQSPSSFLTAESQIDGFFEWLFTTQGLTENSLSDDQLSAWFNFQNTIETPKTQAKQNIFEVF